MGRVDDTKRKHAQMLRTKQHFERNDSFNRVCQSEQHSLAYRSSPAENGLPWYYSILSRRKRVGSSPRVLTVQPRACAEVSLPAEPPLQHAIRHEVTKRLSTKTRGAACKRQNAVLPHVAIIRAHVMRHRVHSFRRSCFPSFFFLFLCYSNS